MSELQSLMMDIESLRKNISDLFESKQKTLYDPEILIASQMLDAAIVKYNEILLEKNKSYER